MYVDSIKLSLNDALRSIESHASELKSVVSARTIGLLGLALISFGLCGPETANTSSKSETTRWEQLKLTTKNIYKTGVQKVTKTFEATSQFIQKHPKALKIAGAALLNVGLCFAIFKQAQKQMQIDQVTEMFRKSYPGEEKLSELSQYLGKSFPGEIKLKKLSIHLGKSFPGEDRLQQLSEYLGKAHPGEEKLQQLSQYLGKSFPGEARLTQLSDQLRKSFSGYSADDIGEFFLESMTEQPENYGEHFFLDASLQALEMPKPSKNFFLRLFGF